MTVIIAEEAYWTLNSSQDISIEVDIGNHLLIQMAQTEIRTGNTFLKKGLISW